MPKKLPNKLPENLFKICEINFQKKWQKIPLIFKISKEITESTPMQFCDKYSEGVFFCKIRSCCINFKINYRRNSQQYPRRNFLRVYKKLRWSQWNLPKKIFMKIAKTIRCIIEEFLRVTHEGVFTITSKQFSSCSNQISF